MIKIIKYDEEPISFMGLSAGICCGADIDDPDKNYIRGMDCLKANHGRVLEYPDIICEISGYSARMMRELYTHIVGVTRLQASTRYIDYNNFDYYIPESILKDKEACEKYTLCMQSIMNTYKELKEDYNIPVEDIANILPMGMMTRIILKINIRALIHLAEIRLCNRAYREFRDFMKELKDVLQQLSFEWAILSKTYMKPKCEILGYCNEKISCGKMPKK